MLRSILVLAASTFLVVSTNAQDCNVCGEDNFIGFPQGVVTFIYDGEERTNNCQMWQNIVKNPVVISDEFCRNEMIYFTAEPCRCFTPNDELVADLLAVQQPTAGPLASGAVDPTEAPVSSFASETLAPTTRNITSNEDTASPAPSASEAPFGSPTDRCIGGDGTVRDVEGCPGANEPSGGVRRSTVALWSTVGVAAVTGVFLVLSGL